MHKADNLSKLHSPTVGQLPWKSSRSGIDENVNARVRLGSESCQHCIEIPCKNAPRSSLHYVVVFDQGL